VCLCVPSDGAQDIAVKDSGVRMNAQHIIHRFIATNLALLLLLLLLLQQQFVLPSFLLDELFVEQFRRDGIGLFDFLVEMFLKNKKKNTNNSEAAPTKHSSVSFTRIDGVHTTLLTLRGNTSAQLCTYPWATTNKQPEKKNRKRIALNE